MTELTSRPPGRPRSVRAEQAIIEATLDLLAEEAGVAAVSIEAVAARAGVGKSTIYRRWPGKEALIIDAMAAAKPPLPAVGGRSARDDLVAIAGAFLAEPRTSHARCVWNVIAGAERYPQLMAEYQRRVLDPRRKAIEDVIRRGVATGELRADLDVEAALQLLIGSFTLSLRARTGPSAVSAERLIDAVLRGLASG